MRDCGSEFSQGFVRAENAALLPLQDLFFKQQNARAFVFCRELVRCRIHRIEGKEEQIVMHFFRKRSEGEDGVADDVFGRIGLGRLGNARKIGVFQNALHDIRHDFVDIVIIGIELLAGNSDARCDFTHQPVGDPALQHEFFCFSQNLHFACAAFLLKLVHASILSCERGKVNKARKKLYTKSSNFSKILDTS